jgi:Flp pilus assembly protein TadD
MTGAKAAIETPRPRPGLRRRVAIWLHARPRVQLGMLLASSGRLPEALKLVQEVEQSAPQSPAPLVLKGYIQLAQNNPKTAVDTFKSALRLAPDLVDAHRGLGQAHEALEQPELAIENYRKAVAIKANDGVALNNLAWLLVEVRKRPEEALPFAIKAQQIAPKHPATLDTLGWNHFRRGAYSDAEKLLTQAVERAPSNGAMQYHLGMTYAKLGDKAFLDSIVLALPSRTLGRRCRGYVLEMGRTISNELYPYLNDPEADIRAALCDLLAQIGDPAAVAHIQPLINDPNRQVADRANRAVERLKAATPSR